jgi:large subunit ribosomal protein L32
VKYAKIVPMVNRMRHNRAQRGNTRSHHALKAAVLSTCPDCGAKKLNHKVCMNCGKYNGKVIIDVLAKVAKKEKKAKQTTK